MCLLKGHAHDGATLITTVPQVIINPEKEIIVLSNNIHNLLISFLPYLFCGA